MQTEKQAKRDSEGYCCSNPNCKSVFSYPKIIKSYVCPNCETLVEMDNIEHQPFIEYSTPEEKQKTHENPKKSPFQGVEKSQNISKIQPTTIEIQKSSVPEITIYPQQITTKINERSITNETQDSDSQFDGTCKHYFGYLCEREKGEGIPNECVECSKNLDCMLSKVYPSTQSVKEIKKWYHFR